MISVKCRIHNQEFRLPSTEEELISGRFHDDVEHLQVHHEKNPNCKLWGDFDEK